MPSVMACELLLEGAMGNRTSLAIEPGNAFTSALIGGLLVVSAFVVGKKVHPWSHHLAGYMVLGMVCTEQGLGMMRHADAIEHLRWVLELCKAYTAFEAATHIAHQRELRHYALFLTATAGARVVLCFGMGFSLCYTFIQSPGFATVNVSGGYVSTPVATGSLAVACALATAVLFTASEPTAAIETVDEARAQGLYSAGALRLTSGASLLSVLAMMLVTPCIASLTHGVGHWAPSTLISVGLTLLVGLLFSRLILALLYMPSKALMQRLAPSFWDDDTVRAAPGRPGFRRAAHVYAACQAPWDVDSTAPSSQLNNYNDKP